MNNLCRAPDHEPIQGKQYPDAEYEALNNSLVRRIGTLNCGHSAYPIIMGISSPQYAPEQLEAVREANEKGITYNGKHYTGYEATQRQRALETAIRKQKRRILIDETTGDAEKLETDQIKLQMLRQEYKRFSKAAGLRTQTERAEVAGFDRRQASAASANYKRIANAANSMYNAGSENQNIKAYRRDLPIRKQIRSESEKLIVNPEKQARHIKNSEGYVLGRSYITVSNAELQDIVSRYAGTGEIVRSSKGEFMNREIITVDREIGISIDPQTQEETPTNRAYIHYSRSGTHVVPITREKTK